MNLERFLRFSDGAVNGRHGMLEGETVIELLEAPFAGARPSGRTFPLSSIRILPPVEPKNVFAMAGNYPNHLWRKKPGEDDPRPFLKPSGSIIACGESILLPGDAGRVDAEAELVIVIGSTCRNVPVSEAPRHVFGFTLGNDISARNWQDGDLSWWRAKGCDTFSPVGPWITRGSAIPDLEISCVVNGGIRQVCRPRELVHGVPEIVSFLSRYATLHPGDLIFTGTAGEPPELRRGDVVEIRSDVLGTLSNPVN